jgi:hypothetical protein
VENFPCIAYIRWKIFPLIAILQAKRGKLPIKFFMFAKMISNPINQFQGGLKIAPPGQLFLDSDIKATEYYSNNSNPA